MLFFKNRKKEKNFGLMRVTSTSSTNVIPGIYRCDLVGGRLRMIGYHDPNEVVPEDAYSPVYFSTEVVERQKNGKSYVFKTKSGSEYRFDPV